MALLVAAIVCASSCWQPVIAEDAKSNRPYYTESLSALFAPNIPVYNIPVGIEGAFPRPILTLQFGERQARILQNGRKPLRPCIGIGGQRLANILALIRGRI